MTRFCASGAGGARLSASGSTDFTVNGGSGDLVLSASGLPQGALGLFFYGAQAQPPSPLGNGFLCVGGGAPVWRLDLLAVGPGQDSVSTEVDYLAPPDGAARISPGSTWNFQFWFRDGGSSDLTDALEVQFVPPIPLSPPTTLLQFSRSGHPLAQTFEGGVVVANTLAELTELWNAHWFPANPVPPLPAVDMSRTTVIAAFAGRRLTSGYFMEVTEVAQSVNTLSLTTLESRPGPGCGVLFSETNPIHLVALRKVDGAALGAWDAQVEVYSCP